MGQGIAAVHANERGAAGLGGIGELLQPLRPAIAQHRRRQKFVGGRFCPVLLDHIGSR